MQADGNLVLYNGRTPVWFTETQGNSGAYLVVQDDGNGRYLNELDFNNTLDPSPYLGMAVNYACNTGTDGCSANPTC